MPEPSFDRWTTTFALVAFLGIFIAPLLWGQAGGRRRQVGYISAILVLFGLTLGYYVLFWAGYASRLPYLMGQTELAALLFGPLFYLYLSELAGQPARRRWPHFALWATALTLALPFVLTSPTLKMGQLQAGRSAGFYAYFFRLLPYVALAQQVGYGVAMWRLRPAFEPLRMVAAWAGRVWWSYAGFVAAQISYYVLIHFSFFNLAWDYGISVAMAAFIFRVAVLAYVQPHVFQANTLPSLAELWATEPLGAGQAGKHELPARSEPPPTAAPPAPANNDDTSPRYQHSGLPASLAHYWAGRLGELMHQEQLYRQPELRLDALAARLGLSRHHLSQVLNDQIGRSFFEYVTHLRIQEAQALLAADHPDLQISDVAWEVGFNNRVSFNKAFKAATGLTPTAYRKAKTATPVGRDAPAWGMEKQVT